jgi:ABC-type transport system substrate-binding protein
MAGPLADGCSSRPDRRGVLQAAGAALVVLPTAARANHAAGARPKVLRYAFQIAETGFDPPQLIDLYSRILCAHIFDPLYRYDYLARPFLIVPNTAVGMPEHSTDFRVWTMRVQPGIFFSDDAAFKGQRRELVAQDYEYALKRFFDPRWKAPGYATLAELKIRGIEPLRAAALKNRTPFDYDRPVEGLRALDRHTLQFSMEEPQPRMLQTLASDLLGATAREVVERYGDEIAAHPVGTGPFRLAAWRRSSRIVLERNPGFRRVTYDAQPNADDSEGQAWLSRFRGRTLPMIDRVEVSIIEETQPRWLSFLNRQQDLLERLPNEFVNIAIPNGELAPHLARRGVQKYRVAGSDVTATIFNMDDPVIGGYTPERVALRRALGLALDVEREIRLVRRGQAIAAQSGFAPLTYGYDPARRTENGQHDLARARALLDTYGYLDRDGDGWRENPDGSPLTLLWATQPDQLSRQMDELRRKDTAAVGLRLQMLPAKWPENMKAVRAGKLMIWSVGLSSSAPDGQPTLDGGASSNIGGQNYARFSHPRLDEIHRQTQSMPDSPARLALFAEAARIMTAYMPYKYHVHRIITDLAQPWLVGYRRPPFSLDWWTFVDIDAEQQTRETA